MVFLFSVKTNNTVVYKSPQELFLDHLLYSKTDLTREQIVVMLRKFDYQDEEMTTPIIRKLISGLTFVAVFDKAEIVVFTTGLSVDEPNVTTSFMVNHTELTMYDFMPP